MKKIVLLTIFIIHSTLFANQFPRSISRIYLSGSVFENVEKLTELGIDIIHINIDEGYANVLVNQSDLRKLEERNYNAETLLTDADAFARRLRGQGYLNHFTAYPEMLRIMEDIVSRYPDIARIESIGDSYVKTAGRGGYEIYVLKISDNVHSEEDEAEVFYMANMHAREIITPEIILHFMRDLVSQYGTDPYITYLVNNRQIWLCPSMNPDGHEYVFTGSNPNNVFIDPMWWRKNKRDNYDTGVFNPYMDGVDLNRNFGYLWGGVGASSNPSSDTYRGSGPFSEPESQAVRDFVLSHQFRIALSFHSHGQLWLYPWGYEDSITPDHETFTLLADSCVHYNGYNAILAAQFYPVSGDTDDWFYGEQELKNKIYAFTPEVGNERESVGGWTGFFPDTSYIQKQILENQGPMMYLAYAAGEEPIVIVYPLPDTVHSDGPYIVEAIIRKPIALSEPVDLDTSSFQLFYNTTGTAPFDSVRLNPDIVIEGSFTGAIPSIGNEEKVYYYVKASDKKGRSGHAPRSAPYSLYTFSVIDDAPSVSISPDNITFTLNQGESVRDSLQITNHGLKPQEFLLECAPLSETDKPSITIDPHFGTIAAEDSIFIVFTIDGATAGIDTLLVNFFVNNFDVPYLYIPLYVNVNPASVVTQNSLTPLSHRIFQNYPNPFNSTTRIRYQLHGDADISITLFNMLGNRVRTLVHKRDASGSHNLTWDGTDDNGRVLPNGVYICRFQSNDFTKYIKMLLLQ